MYIVPVSEYIDTGMYYMYAYASKHNTVYSGLEVEKQCNKLCITLQKYEVCAQ